jgi:LEA14-like dessication related protein
MFRFHCLPVISALLLGACTLLPTGLEPPRVSLVNIEPREMTLFEQRYRVSIRIQNPNPDPLRLRGLSYELDLNGKEFASGVGRSDLEVPGFGNATIDTDLTSSVFALIEQVRMLQGGGGTLSYSLEGTLHLAGGIGRLPFQRQGDIDFRPPPVLAPTGPAI